MDDHGIYIAAEDPLKEQMRRTVETLKLKEIRIGLKEAHLVYFKNQVEFFSSEPESPDFAYFTSEANLLENEIALLRNEFAENTMMVAAMQAQYNQQTGMVQAVNLMPRGQARKQK